MRPVHHGTGTLSRPPHMALVETEHTADRAPVSRMVRNVAAEKNATHTVSPKDIAEQRCLHQDATPVDVFKSHRRGKESCHVSSATSHVSGKHKVYWNACSNNMTRFTWSACQRCVSRYSETFRPAPSCSLTPVHTPLRNGRLSTSSCNCWTRTTKKHYIHTPNGHTLHGYTISGNSGRGCTTTHEHK